MAWPLLGTRAVSPHIRSLEGFDFLRSPGGLTTARFANGRTLRALGPARPEGEPALLRTRPAGSAALLLLALCSFASVADGAIPVAVLHWTATGDDGAIGRATRYDIRRSLLPITTANFFLGDTVGGVPLPATAGTAQACPVLLPVAGRTHYFALRAVDERGNWSLVSNVASYTAPIVDVAEPGLQVRAFDPPWPNPARGRAMFRIASPSGDATEVSVYDALGRRVRTLWDGQLEPGRHGVEWDLRDEKASPVAPGVYYVRVRLGTWTRVRSVVVTR